MDRNSPLRQCEYDFIALHRYLNPGITKQALTDLVKTQFGISISDKQYRTALDKTSALVEKLHLDEDLALKIARGCNLVKLTNKVARILSLESIVSSAVANAHEQAAVAALKLIKEELTAAQATTPDIKVVIGTISPPKADEDIEITPEEYAEL